MSQKASVQFWSRGRSDGKSNTSPLSTPLQGYMKISNFSPRNRKTHGARSRQNTDADPMKCYTIDMVCRLAYSVPSCTAQNSLLRVPYNSELINEVLVKAARWMKRAKIRSRRNKLQAWYPTLTHYRVTVQLYGRRKN